MTHYIVTRTAADVQEELRRAFVGRFQREPALMFTTIAAGGAQAIPCPR